MTRRAHETCDPCGMSRIDLLEQQVAEQAAELERLRATVAGHERRITRLETWLSGQRPHSTGVRWRRNPLKEPEA